MTAYDQALKIALAALRQRDMLAAELKVKLENRGVEPAIIESVLSYLKQRRFLDDSRTIDQTIARASGKRAVGKNKLQADLNRRGAPEEIVEAQLAAILPETERQQALELLRLKLKPSDSRGKAGRLLLARGFDEDLVESVLIEFLGEVEFSDSEIEHGS